MATQPDTNPINDQTQQPPATHIFILKVGHKSKEYTDPQKAGAAYFAADPDKNPKPSVTHTEHNRSRIMASTEVHGTYEDGQPRYYKSLPDVLPVDKEFQAGFYGALEKSLRKRLQQLNRPATESKDEQAPPKLDERLAADLERFANVNPEKAQKLWQKNAPESIAAPAYLENPTMGKNGTLDQQRDVGARKAIESTTNDLMAVPKDAMDKKTAQEVVRDDLMAFNMIENKAERQLAAIAIGHSANGQATYRTALQQQNPDVAKEAAAEFAETLRRKTAPVENVIAFYDRSQEQSAAPSQQTPREQAGDSQGSPTSNQATNQDVPERVAARYLRLKNLYYFQDKTLAFEDGGKKLKLETENITVIRDAVAIAEARSWQAITVSGTDNFKQQVWREATLKGIEVVGYKPTKLAEAELLKAMATRDAKNEASEKKPQQRDDVTTGVLLAHGADHYQHDPEKGKSYFVKLEVNGKEVTKWGADFKRAFADSQSQPQVGDTVVLSNTGKQSVNIPTQSRDEDGNEVTTKKPVQKTTWRIEKEEYQAALEQHAEALRTGKEIEQKVIAQIPQVREAVTAAKLGEKIAEQAHQSGVIKSEDEKNVLVYLIREGLASALEKGKKINTPEIVEQGKQATIDANSVLNDHKPPVMTKEPAKQELAR